MEAVHGSDLAPGSPIRLLDPTASSTRPGTGADVEPDDPGELMLVCANCGARMDDDDHEHAEVVEVIRAWNRVSGPEAREYLWPYLQHAARNGFGPINMGVTIDA